MAVEVRYYIDQSLMGVWHEWGIDREDVTAVGELAGTTPGGNDVQLLRDTKSRAFSIIRSLS